jgi:pyruvate carboxylase
MRAREREREIEKINKKGEERIVCELNGNKRTIK